MTKKRPLQQEMIPPAPSPPGPNNLGGVHVFFSSDKVKIFVKARAISAMTNVRFTLYRSVFPQPGQENIFPLGDFDEWGRACMAGERAARFEEGREIDAGYASAFAKKKAP